MKSIITTRDKPPTPTFTLEIDEYSWNAWCPTSDGSGPAEQVHFILKLKDSRPDLVTSQPLPVFVMRFKSRQAIDQFIAIAQQYADEVFGERH